MTEGTEGNEGIARANGRNEATEGKRREQCLRHCKKEVTEGNEGIAHSLRRDRSHSFAHIKRNKILRLTIFTKNINNDKLNKELSNNIFVNLLKPILNTIECDKKDIL